MFLALLSVVFCIDRHAPLFIQTMLEQGEYAVETTRHTMAYVSMGSNMGNSQALLEQAGAALAALPGLTLDALSSVYKTEPQTVREQPFFFNRVAALRCTNAIQPLDLLDALLRIEEELGRDRRGAIRFGPRTMDLDLLLFGNKSMTSRRLILPHPRMLERAFVLVPLADIAPDLPLPTGGTVRKALEKLAYSLEDGVILQK